jgi:exonuclease SbcD
VKLLHTSDWHVGKAIRGHSRADEHQAVLTEIAGIADEHDVDLVVVAGDLFDSSTPNPESEDIVYRSLLQLAGADRTVAIIAGNHDNARRLRAIAPLLALGRVHLVAEPARPDEGGVLKLVSRGKTDVRMAMLPFVSKRGIVRADELMGNAAFENAQVYSDRLRRLIDHLCSGFETDCVNVLAGHAFVLGGQLGGGERAAHVFDEYAITAQSFPPTISYGALGHLHRPQRVPAGAPIHYCGSPLQLDFGETGHTKSVNVVSLEPGIPADVSSITLTSGRHLRTIKGTLEQILDTPPTGDDWLRVVVEGTSQAGLADRIRTELGDGVVDVRVESDRAVKARASDGHVDRSPTELFGEYLQLENIDDSRVVELFAELLDVDLDGADA